ncbi:MAG: DUF4390 domain-containing protein [Deltaproteobacteria bacterium]|nr:DUF4390 domain-containing protein [Deltaproteobacteria bacterium]
MKKLISGLILIMLAVLPGGGFCADPLISDVAVSTEPDIRLSFVVREAFSRDMEEAVKSGAPTTFTFKVEINRIRSAWFNEDIARWEFKHTVKYDTLKEEYEITLDESGTPQPGAGPPPTRTKDFNEMKRLMSSGSSIPIETSRPLQKGENYEVRLKAGLRTIKLPFLLDYVLFFVKFWDFETDWHTHRFSL